MKLMNMDLFVIRKFEKREPWTVSKEGSSDVTLSGRCS